MAKKRALRHGDRVKAIYQYDDPETGAPMIRIELPDEDAPQPKPLTPVHQAVVAIYKKRTRRRRRDAVPPTRADVEKWCLEFEQWDDECRRLEIRRSPPKWPTIQRALDRAGLPYRRPQKAKGER